MACSLWTQIALVFLGLFIVMIFSFLVLIGVNPGSKIFKATNENVDPVQIKRLTALANSKVLIILI